MNETVKVESKLSCLTDSYRLPTTLRLSDALDFKQVFAFSKKYKNHYFSVLVKPNGLAHPRLGMTVAKRYVRRAVARNTIKRHIRETFRLNQQQLGGNDIVVMTKSSTNSLTNSELNLAIGELWNVLKNSYKKAQ